MKAYTYLIIGGGITADSAVRGIRQVDASGSIGLLSEETNPPYNRPPLSKGLWLGKPLARIWRNTTSLGADVLLGRRAVAIDPAAHTVTDSLGETYSYKKLLIASGVTPRHFPFGGDEIIYYRTLADYQTLNVLAQEKDEFTIIGGGFIGSELAAVLNAKGKKVTMVMLETGINARLLPADLVAYLGKVYEEKGVRVLPGQNVLSVAHQGTKVVTHISDVKTGQEQQILSDAIVAGIGALPNDQIAASAGLPVKNGILVDEFLRAGEDIYAAGDVAAFHNQALGMATRVEHEDNANSMGLQAGKNMAGDVQPYDHLPYFYSDMFDLGYEAVGELDPRLEVIADWQEPFRKGVLYYLKEQKVRGVLLWNVWQKVEAARLLIKQPGQWNETNLRGKIT
jgi:3-phenylpropionate/trans-cinnamate dioxygenase ferredoxin reductase component